MAGARNAVFKETDGVVCDTDDTLACFTPSGIIIYMNSRQSTATSCNIAHVEPMKPDLCALNIFWLEYVKL